MYMRQNRANHPRNARPRPKDRYDYLKGSTLAFYSIALSLTLALSGLGNSAVWPFTAASYDGGGNSVAQLELCKSLVLVAAGG